MALIDQAAAKAKVAETILGASELAIDMRRVCYEAIDAAPAIDAASVVRGRWIPDGKEHVHCTNCGDGRNIRTQIGWNFCPSCGARMDGGEGHG